MWRIGCEKLSLTRTVETHDASRALSDVQRRVTAAEDRAVAAEVRAQVAEAEAREAKQALALVEDAIRRRLLCASPEGVSRLYEVA